MKNFYIITDYDKYCHIIECEKDEVQKEIYRYFIHHYFNENYEVIKLNKSNINVLYNSYELHLFLLSY